MPELNGQQKDINPAELLQSLAASLKTLEALPTMISQSVASSVGTVMQENARVHQQQQNDNRQEPEVPKFDGDIEDASREEFAEHIFKVIDHKLGMIVEKISGNVQNLDEKVDMDRIKREIEIAKSKYGEEDFTAFNAEMKEILSKHPDMAIDDIYHLARSRNPDKVKELEAKKEEKAKEEKPAQNQQFGGLFPTSTVTANPENSGKMSPAEAADKAWQETMGSGSELPGDLLES